MKNLILGVLSVFVLSFAAAPVQAQSTTANPIYMKAHIFDNNTGGPLTTVTQNVGISLILKNNVSGNSTAGSVTLENVELGAVTFVNMALSNPAQDNPPPVQNLGIIWPQSVTNPYGTNRSVIVNGSEIFFGATLLPVSKAEHLVLNTPIQHLPQGLFYPTIVVIAFDYNTGKTISYTVAVDPVEVL